MIKVVFQAKPVLCVMEGCRQAVRAGRKDPKKFYDVWLLTLQLSPSILTDGEKVFSLTRGGMPLCLAGTPAR